MDLWIRSQDRERLMKVNGFDYVDFNDEYVINGFGTNECDNYDLGTYTSKERALEVLDEIQERITLLNLMSTINGEKEMIKIAHAFGEDKINGVLKPYQMPKE